VLNNYPALPTYNPESARASLQEATGGEMPSLSIATVNVGILPSVTQALAKELENLGFKTEVTVYEENQDFITSVISQRSYDLLVYEVELGAEPDLLPYYHSSQASNGRLNLSNYRNFLVDDLLLAARDTIDEELRVKKYETFLNYWVEDVPAIGLYRPNLLYFYNQNVRTFSNDVRLVTSLDRFVDVNDWAIVKTQKNKTP
jgi:ABC-type transport system substrate-binding protein